MLSLTTVEEESSRLYPSSVVTLEGCTYLITINLSPRLMNTLNQLKAVLIFIAICHLFFGFGLMFSIDFQKAAIANYGGTLEWNTTNIYFIRMMGVNSSTKRNLLTTYTSQCQTAPFPTSFFDMIKFQQVRKYLKQPYTIQTKGRQGISLLADLLPPQINCMNFYFT
jgi:hypothetical protein